VSLSLKATLERSRHARPQSAARVHRRGKARLGSWRGALWSLLAAASFFLLSYPRDLLPDFLASISWLAVGTLVVVLLDVKNVRWPVVPWPITVFLAVGGSSALWSIEPADTARTFVVYATITLIAGLVVANSEATVLLRGITWGTVIVVGVTLWSVVTERAGAGGPLGVLPISGVHGNRNILSYTLLLGLCAVLSYRPSGRFSTLRWLAPAVLGTCTLVLARSGTGIVSGFVILLSACLLASAHRYELFGSVRIRLAGGAVIAGVGVLGIASVGAVAEVFGKTSDFSGRLPAWSAILEVWSGAPVLGYGWGAVWQYSWLSATPNDLTNRIAESTGIWYSHGHNSFFDLLPQLGALGAVLLVVIVVYAARWVALPSRDGDFTTVRWGTLGSVGFVVCSVTEPIFMTPVGWFVIVVLAACAREVARARRFC